MKTEKNPDSGKRKTLIIILCLLLALIITTIGACFVTAKYYLNKINRVDPNESTIPPEHEDFETDEPPYNDSEQETTSGQITEPAPDTSAPDSDTAKPDELIPIGDEKLLNILLVGQDRREGQGRQRSDSMILCSINLKTYEASLISFMRDLYVPIPGGYSSNRLNAAYAFGGFPLLDDTLYQNFGVTIDGNFEVDFNGFKSVINTFGGVEITLSDEEAKYLFGIPGGTYLLSGEEALTYSRLRDIGDDFERTARQRKVIVSLFEKIRTMSATNITKLLDTVLPMLTTDMSDGEIVSIAAKLIPVIPKIKLSQYRVPSGNTYIGTYINRMAVLLPDLPAIREQMLEYLPLD